MTEIRLERPEDRAAIRLVTEAAFRLADYSDGTEGRIIDALRSNGALALSVVGVLDGEVVGQATFSRVRVNGVWAGWYGLGPVSVIPKLQRRGIGAAMIAEGLRRLVGLQAAGCVVFGDPAYYGRFGFTADPRLTYADAPPKYFQRLVFKGPDPIGEVDYHESFSSV